MQVKKQQLELDMEQQTGSKSGKKHIKAVYCHPDYLTYMHSTSCKMPGWMKFKWETRLPGEISTTSDMQMTPPLWQKASWWKWKNLLKKVKEESEKVGLKFNIHKTNIMMGVEAVTDLIFPGSKITAMVTAAMKLKDAYSLEEKLWPT